MPGRVLLDEQHHAFDIIEEEILRFKEKDTFANLAKPSFKLYTSIQIFALQYFAQANNLLLLATFRRHVFDFEDLRIEEKIKLLVKRFNSEVLR